MLTWQQIEAAYRAAIRLYKDPGQAGIAIAALMEQSGDYGGPYTNAIRTYVQDYLTEECSQSRIEWLQFYIAVQEGRIILPRDPILAAIDALSVAGLTPGEFPPLEDILNRLINITMPSRGYGEPYA